MSEISLFSKHVDLILPASDSFSFSEVKNNIQQKQENVSNFFNQIPIVLQYIMQLLAGLSIGFFLSLLIFDVKQSTNFTVIPPIPCRSGFILSKHSDKFQLPDSVLRTSRVLQTLILMSKPRIYQRTICLRQEDVVFNFLNSTYGKLEDFPQFNKLDNDKQQKIILRLFNENLNFNGEEIVKPELNLSYLVLLLPTLPTFWLLFNYYSEQKADKLYNQIIEALNNQRLRNMAGFDEKLHVKDIQSREFRNVYQKFSRKLSENQEIIIVNGVYQLLTDN